MIHKVHNIHLMAQYHLCLKYAVGVFLLYFIKGREAEHCKGTGKQQDGYTIIAHSMSTRAHTVVLPATLP